MISPAIIDLGLAAYQDASQAEAISPLEAETLLADLAAVFLSNSTQPSAPDTALPDETEEQLPNVDAIYRALVEQIPAVVFMAQLDRGIGEAYVSPQIEASLGFSQEEWLEDPIRWYQQIHPDDKPRWSVEAAQMFLSGSALRSAYRVLARDGRVVWFHCEAKMIRRKNGRPWFIHGIAFDITELKRTEEALQEERNVVSAILHTVGALVVVLDPQGRIARFNRACEQGVFRLFLRGGQGEILLGSVRSTGGGRALQDHCRTVANREQHQRLRDVLGGAGWLAAADCVVKHNPSRRGWNACIHYRDRDRHHGKRKRLEKAILEISAEEQRRRLGKICMTVWGST